MVNSHPEIPKATIIVAPRERYGVARKSLESVRSETPAPYDLVYVTSAAPRELDEWLASEAKDKGFKHISVGHQITPNEARNLGAKGARTPYLLFIDNDVICSPGWLDHLIRCAEETGADVVAPLTCHGAPVHSIIHQAGGEFAPHPPTFFKTPAGERDIVEVMHLQGVKVGDVSLARTETQACEFHCVLVRRETFEALDGLDEGMMATKEHLDFCMCVIARGGKVMLEPASVVTYLFPNRLHPIERSDWPFFLVRWSPEWQQRSLEHFRKKWGLRSDRYLAERADMLHWRQYEGVIKPTVRKLPWVSRIKLAESLANRIVGRLVRDSVKRLTRRADRLRSATTVR